MFHKLRTEKNQDNLVLQTGNYVDSPGSSTYILRKLTSKLKHWLDDLTEHILVQDKLWYILFCKDTDFRTSF